MYRYLMLFFIPLFCFFLQSCQPTSKTSRTKYVTVDFKDPTINGVLGKLFMAKNKLKPGVITLPTGLQYSVIVPGIGDHPKDSDLVTVYYQGQYINGEIFDNQHTHKNPVTARVSALVPGWQEALKLMQVGSVWVLYVPPQLAFGEKGLPGVIGPNQTLIYNVHLLNFKKG